jgi:hypothetical protein
MMDERGVDFLGMKLVVVLVLAALLLSIAAVYVSDYVDKASRDMAGREASRIASIAEAEYASGAPGSAAAMAVSIPAGIRRIGFGENDPAAYSIEFDDGSAEVHVAGCRFSPAALYPGKYRINARLVESGGSYSISLEEE